MGRLLILIFPKLADALLLARFAVSAPVRIRRDARVRTDSLRFDLTQTETLVPEKRLSLSLSLFFFFFALPSANATGLHGC